MSLGSRVRTRKKMDTSGRNRAVVRAERNGDSIGRGPGRPADAAGSAVFGETPPTAMGDGALPKSVAVRFGGGILAFFYRGSIMRYRRDTAVSIPTRQICLSRKPKAR